MIRKIEYIKRKLTPSFLFLCQPSSEERNKDENNNSMNNKKKTALNG